MSSGFIKTADGTEIFYKDWGSKSGQPIVFHHGWPLSSDDWDAQMLFFLQSGYRVVAHDRRGHGRSSQVDSGNDMDHYAADASAVVEHLNLRNAVHIGHSTGGGEVARYVAKFGQPQGRVAKAVLVSSVPPLMLKTAANPMGLPKAVFDDLQLWLVQQRILRNQAAAGKFPWYRRFLPQSVQKHIEEREPNMPAPQYYSCTWKATYNQVMSEPVAVKRHPVLLVLVQLPMVFGVGLMFFGFYVMSFIAH